MTDASEWKHEATEPVLRVLYQAGIGVSPESIAVNLDEAVENPPTEEEVQEALDGLESENMVREIEAGYYALTDHGRDYVDREIEKQGIGFIE